MTSSVRLRVLFAALYFAEGAPIGWLWWTLPSQLRRQGVAVDEITALTAALAIPWACKFLWAPLVDTLRTRWFGLRAWLVLAQLGMAATLVPMLWLEPVAHWQVVTGLLLAHAFCAATQDVAIDALAIRAVPAAERGALNGAMQVGQIGGRVLFSTGILWLAASTGQRLAVPLLLGVLGVTLVLALCVKVTASEAPGWRPPAGRRARYLRVLVRTPRFWRLAAFALLGGAGFEAAGALSGSWLVDRGLDDAEVGTFRLVCAGLMAGGALLGGMLADRHGARRVARHCLVPMAAMVAAAGLLDLVALFALIYLGAGVFVSASYALFMQGATGPLAATMFSGFMGLTNACEAWAGRGGGALQSDFGYGPALTAMAGLSLLAWWLLPGPRSTAADRAAR